MGCLHGAGAGQRGTACRGRRGATGAAVARRGVAGTARGRAPSKESGAGPTRAGASGFATDRRKARSSWREKDRGRLKEE